MFFTRYFFKRLRKQKFIVNWHHEVGCNALEEVQIYEWELLNMTTPPRTSKTELAAVNFISRSLGMNANANFLYITSSDELRSETSVRIRDIVTDEHFQLMYNVHLKKDQKAKNLWRTEQGGGLKTATINGQITGFGAGQMIQHDEDLEDYIREFEGCIVLDDINKIDDVINMTAANAKVARVIFNTVLSRRNSSDTPIINIQQRAGVKDATGELLAHFKGSGKVKNLVFHAIGRKGSHYENKSMWEWKLPLEDLIRMKNSPKTKYTYESQYDQNPIPDEGGTIERKWVKFIKEEFLDADIVWDLWIDGAYTEDKKNDPSGLMMAGHDFINDRMIIRNFESVYLGLPKMLEYIPKFVTRNGGDITTTIWIEPKASGISLKQMLEETVEYDCHSITGRLVNVKGGKTTRLNYAAPKVKFGEVWLVEGDWNTDFLYEVCGFPIVEHDEVVDLLGYSAYKYLKKD